MKTLMNAVGFSNIKDDKALDEIVEDVFKNPSYTYTTEYDDQVIIESYKEYGKQIYLSVSVIIDRNSREYPDVTLGECEPYVEANYETEVYDLYIEEVEGDYVYLVIMEEKKTGTEIVFTLQNVVEFLDYDDYLRYNGVKIVGISTEGSILLPIYKTNEDIAYEKNERVFSRNILEMARAGDQESLELLENEESQQEYEMRLRLEEEDFYTVVDGYFTPLDLLNDEYLESTYHVLGTIVELEKRENYKTKEKMYWFKLDVSGMDFEILINTKDLLGQPFVGMRFEGVCSVQGRIEFI